MDIIMPVSVRIIMPMAVISSFDESEERFGMVRLVEDEANVRFMKRMAWRSNVSFRLI
jgi:hypothetical protein